MSERIRLPRSTKWACLAAVSALALIASGIVVASPLQRDKKASGKATADQSKKNDQSKRNEGDSSLAGPIVARVNGEEITYKALAEEVIARKGKEVLDTMISRLLVEQACRQAGVKITAQEIHDEVTRTAERLNMTTEQYLKVLQDKREMDYKQYERDIVIPGLSLKKMARPHIKVTEDDIQRGFEAYYGEKVRCRWIMLNDRPTAMKVWNELKGENRNGSGKVDLAEFERQVTRWSVDPSSRSIGGQLNQPIGRHTGPAFERLEKAAFALKEDGEISGVIEFGEAHVILYREGRVPPANVKLEDVRSKIEADIYDAKMRDQIEQIFVSIQKSATIENLLTGAVSSPENKTVPAEHIEQSDKAKPPGKTEPQKKAGSVKK
jgi:foldase protein PrsA